MPSVNLENAIAEGAKRMFSIKGTYGYIVEDGVSESKIQQFT